MPAKPFKGIIKVHHYTVLAIFLIYVIVRVASFYDIRHFIAELHTSENLVNPASQGCTTTRPPSPTDWEDGEGRERRTKREGDRKGGGGRRREGGGRS